MEPEYRPYRDTRDGSTVLLTDEQIAAMEPGHPYRRLRPGEEAPPVSNATAEPTILNHVQGAAHE